MKGYQRSLLIDESPLQVIPALAKAIGLNEAIMLQQIHYWSRISEHEKDGRRYVAMSAPDMAEKFCFWSEATVKRTVASLREKGLLLVTKKSKTSWERVNWCAVDYDVLNHLNLSIVSERSDASGQVEPMQKVNLTKSTGADCTDRPGQPDPITNNDKNKSKKDGSAPATPGAAAPTTAAWNVYEEMMQGLYGFVPPRNATVNGQLSTVVKRVGAEDAPKLVRHFFVVKNDYYARRKHELGLLLTDCNRLLIEMKTAARTAIADRWWEDPTKVTDRAKKEGIKPEPNDSYARIAARLFVKIGDGPWMSKLDPTVAKYIHEYSERGVPA
jgi:hypothetical protein